MEIEEKSYDYGWNREAGEYIHRYYLPEQFWDELQPRDMMALYSRINALFHKGKSAQEIEALLLEAPCSIRYRLQRIVKEVPSDLMTLAIQACLDYYQDRWTLGAQVTQ